MGRRISDLRLRDEPLAPEKTYKVAGWAPVAEGAGGAPVWDIVEGWLKDRKTVTPRKLNQPRLIGVERNPGIAS